MVSKLAFLGEQKPAASLMKRILHLVHLAFLLLEAFRLPVAFLLLVAFRLPVAFLLEVAFGEACLLVGRKRVDFRPSG